MTSFGNIDKNDRSLAVKEVQTFLRALTASGYLTDHNIVVDGVYGKRTEDAVIDFQNIVGIPVTGKVDLLTYNILFEEYSLCHSKSSRSVGIYPFTERLKNRRICRGDKGNIVYIIQIILETLSVVYEFEEQKINGIYDSATKRNISSFQEISGIEVTGEVDRETWDMLAREYDHMINRE